MTKDQLRALTEPMYYVLLALFEERHGYDIMQTIEAFTEGRVIIGPGTLYALLARFEKEGIISQVSEDNRRKNYLITDKGKEVLDNELRRLRKQIGDGEKVLANMSMVQTREEDTMVEEEDMGSKATIKEDIPLEELVEPKDPSDNRVFRRLRDDEILW